MQKCSQQWALVYLKALVRVKGQWQLLQTTVDVFYSVLLSLETLDQHLTHFLFLLVGWQAQRHVTDLYEDLRDGHNLISLLEVLSGESLVSIYDVGQCSSTKPEPHPH